MLRSAVRFRDRARSLPIASMLAFGLALTGCGDPPGEGDSANDDADDDDADADADADAGTDDTPTDDGTADSPWFEIGWGQDEFSPLSEGDTFEIVFGTQGSAMFPIIVRGGDFVLPPDPADWQHEAAPIVELWLDIEGHNDGFGGHFKRIANYPLGFEVMDDGTYQSTYIAIILPDDKTPQELEGLAATLSVELDTVDAEPVELELDLTVALGEIPG